MQNHAKKWFNNTTSTNAMAAIAIGAMLVFSVAGMKAFADVIENTIAADVTRNTIVEGGSTTATYWVRVQSGINDPQNACNAADTTPLTFSVNFPSGVTATVDGTEKTSPFDLKFTKCGEGNGQQVTFSSNTAGSYPITTNNIKDSGTGTYTDNSDFTLTVTEPAAPEDTTAPVITADIQGTEGDNGWYTSDVTVQWTITDEESTVTATDGCDDVTISEDTDSDGRTITCEATSAGGTSSESVTIKRDATDPIVSLVGGPADGSSYFYGFLPDKPTCTAEDPTPGSGLAGDCTVGDYDNNAGAGDHTVTATAKDNAGNTAEDANAYTVKKWIMEGFYQPVDNKPTVNTVKGGSTVPFKFDISADTEFTSTTFNGAQIVKLAQQKVSCTSNAGLEDAIELTATGGTTLRYDSSAGQFVYNWQTAKGAGICYEVTVTDQSGSSLTALFKTK